MRLQPIRAFCFHHVSDSFDDSTMKRCDWLPTDMFKQLILQLREEGYTFISLPEAQVKLQHDAFRRSKYAVLTADDGWASLKNILPWLHEQQIPITLFLNPAYLDGMHYRDSEKEKYLTKEDVLNLHTQYSLLTIGTHGWEHRDPVNMTDQDFKDSLQKSIEYLKEIPNYIPYFAFPYGHHKGNQIDIVNQMGVVPVMVGWDGENYSDRNYIDRELLGIDYLKQYIFGK